MKSENTFQQNKDNGLKFMKDRELLKREKVIKKNELCKTGSRCLLHIFIRSLLHFNICLKSSNNRAKE